ncbi:putative ABC transporter substrate-binding protein [Gordonia hirsuta DSM 44140 = NBRC 16056]|uniref:Putative ABC transporter substrate-binding protein n=1 Tax=Gordonia hirsuta DSM 44140 = NBRC 16056 TaxID=1121927 RepID=L7L8N8_9ACTN|nr:glycine betaine ABC transporter substrate-binding protein [Gordonia hirsuta]GAC57299.1 putative ABC transporter substrate-binding protein [Gordonia hirsuta DSM 44140 = NBRC 16056]
MSARRSPRRGGLLVLAVLLVVSLVGCGLVSSSGTYRSAKLPDGERPLDGVDLTITSKDFTEQVILGKITATYLSAAGAEVMDMTGAPGSAAARQVLINGQADIMWDYTGTAWQAYHAQTETVAEPHELWQRVHDLDRDQNDLIWLPPAQFNNTYAFAAAHTTAERLGVRTMSEVAALPVNERTFCINDEFFSRSDGLQPMLATYGIPLGAPNGTPQGNVTAMDSGVVYSSTAASRPCNFGMVYTTDGRIQNLNLTVMEDDRKFFLPYNGAAIVARQTYENHPELAVLLGKISEKLTEPALQALNAEVDINGVDPADVAYDWLIAEGLVVPAV